MRLDTSLLRPIHYIWSLTKDMSLPFCPKGSGGSSFKRSAEQQYLLGWLMGACFGWLSWGERDRTACTLGGRKEKPTRHLFALHIMPVGICCYLQESLPLLAPPKSLSSRFESWNYLPWHKVNNTFFSTSSHSYFTLVFLSVPFKQ